MLPQHCCMTHYKNIRPTLISWIDWSLHPQTTATHFLTTMDASGHIGDVTLVEIVFVNFVNKGWVGSTQGDLHRNTGCEYGGKHFSFVLNLFVFLQENKVHSVALGLRRSLFVQFSNLSFLCRWAWVYTTDQLMPGPKIMRVPLEMQTTFPPSLCYPWPGHAYTSTNHLRSSMKCKQRWRLVRCFLTQFCCTGSTL